jgi:hypothetical protein
VTKRPLLALSALAAAGILVGCSSGSTPVAGPTVTPIPTTHSHHPHPKTTAPATPTSSPATTTPAAAAAACTTPQLQLTLGQGQGSAGSFDIPVILSNNGSTPCTLAGYPGVSYTTNSGTQVGPSADRNPQPSAASIGTITLAPGQSASADLHQPDPGDFTTGCDPQKAARVRVYPPGQTQPLSVADSVTVCSGSQGRSAVTVMQSGDQPQA